jgi:hypothetical protein
VRLGDLPLPLPDHPHQGWQVVVECSCRDQADQRLCATLGERRWAR